MTRRWIPFAVLGAAVVAVTLLMLFHEGVRSAILDPFVTLFESTAYIFRSIPQAIVWTAAIIIAGLHVYRIWPDVKIPGVHRKRSNLPLTGESEWTLLRLSQMLRDAQRKRSARAVIVRALAETAVHLIARHHGISPSDARDRLLARDWTENHEMADFLATRTLAEPVAKEGFEEKLRRAIEFLETYYQEV